MRYFNFPLNIFFFASQAPDNHPLFKGPPRRATSLKVVCDTMLQGLGRQLRLCGVDTRILNNSEDHSSAIMVCL